MKTRFLISLFIFILPLAVLSPAFSGNATLSWQPNTEPDLNGYNVYYGTTSRNYKSAIPVGEAGSYEFTDLVENTTYYFAVTAVDTSGNESGFSKEVQKSIPVPPPPKDTIQPVVTIAQPTGNSNYATGSARINLSGTASDNVGVTRISWSNSAGGSGDASGTANWSVSAVNLKEGANILTVTAIDAAGNNGTDTLAITYTPPDTAAPSITITSPTTAATFTTENDKISLAGKASDNMALKQVTWKSSTGASGTASGTTNWSVSGISLKAGTNQITLSAVDTSGNKADRVLNITCQLPQPPPAATLVSDLQVASGKAYQFVSGLKPSAPAYIDNAVAYDRIPDALNGVHYIKTAQADSGNTDSSFMSFKVTDDVYVFVAYDLKNRSKPQWLGAFSPARLYLRMKNRQYMQLHSKEFSAGQTVVLGGNGSGNMYTVVVVPKDEMPEFEQTGPRSIIIGPQ